MTPVPCRDGQNSLKALCAARLGAPRLAGQPWKGPLCSLSSVPHCQECMKAPTGRAGAPKDANHTAGESMAAGPPRQSPLAWRCHAVPPLHKGGCSVTLHPDCAAALGNRTWLVVSAWPRQGLRREAGKRSGKNLVFPRGPAAASPDGLQVILALCQNNTPRVAQEGPGGFRRWEETWGNTRRSGCSGY